MKKRKPLPPIKIEYTPWNREVKFSTPRKQKPEEIITRAYELEQEQADKLGLRILSRVADGKGDVWEMAGQTGWVYIPRGPESFQSVLEEFDIDTPEELRTALDEWENAELEVWVEYEESRLMGYPMVLPDNLLEAIKKGAM